MTFSNIMGLNGHQYKLRCLALDFTVLAYQWHNTVEVNTLAGLEPIFSIDKSTATYTEYGSLAKELVALKEEAKLYDWDMEPIRALYRIFVIEVEDLLQWMGIDHQGVVDAIAASDIGENV